MSNYSFNTKEEVFSFIVFYAGKSVAALLTELNAAPDVLIFSKWKGFFLFFSKGFSGIPKPTTLKNTL